MTATLTVTLKYNFPPHTITVNVAGLSKWKRMSFLFSRNMARSALALIYHLNGLSRLKRLLRLWESVSGVLGVEAKGVSVEAVEASLRPSRLESVNAVALKNRECNRQCS